MTKTRITVEIEFEDNYFEFAEDHCVSIEDEGITKWHYGCPNIILPWKTIRKEVIG